METRFLAAGLRRREASPKSVLVLGAGVAGLVAGYELRRAGHEVTILEATHRVGGRVYTVREPFSDGLYGEGGAMRVPRSHPLVNAYCEHFGLEMAPFTAGNGACFYHLGGRQVRMREAWADMSVLPWCLPPEEEGRSVARMWQDAIAPLLEAVRGDPAGAWPRVIAEYDHMSLEEFLEHRGFSDTAIEMYALVESWEPLMNSSFLEVLREEADRCFEDVRQVVGGMDRLPQAFVPHLDGCLRFGAPVVHMHQDSGGVTVTCRNPAGRFQVRAERVVCTLPFTVLRHVEVEPAMSLGMQKAVRQLSYQNSTKIFLQCRRRFWEDDESIVGGGTVTDLPIRNLYYPEHGQGSGRGVLLASYTWGQDADIWAALPAQERTEQAIENVAQVHPQIVDEFEVGASVAWGSDPFAGGAFALFDPLQQTRLHDIIEAPEGRIHFAGEHTSLRHAWIEGALESGLRAAREIHEAD